MNRSHFGFARPFRQPSSQRVLGTSALVVAAFMLTNCSPAVMPGGGDASPDGAGLTDGAAIGRTDGQAGDAAVMPTQDVPGADVVLPPATAIVAPNEAWTWIDFPEALCGNGSSTGIAVNLTSRSNRVFVYMEGGGACWNDSTCYSLSTAANLSTGYTNAQFRRELPTFDRVGIFSRTDMMNPFRDASYVFIPYCTGDTHGGYRTQVYDAENNPERVTHHVGGRNVEYFLRRLVPTFSRADRVWLSGSSAGGFGTVMNWGKFQAAFTMARVDLLNDAGQPVDANPGQINTWKRAWGLQVPADCPECNTSLAAVMSYYHRTMTRGNRSALMATLQDQTLRGFFLTTPLNFEAATRRLLTDHYNGQMNARYWVMAGEMHTFIGQWRTYQSPGGRFLRDWLRQFAEDDATWSNEGPPPAM